MSLHADVLELIDYAGGRLPTERSQQLRRHCTECAECGDRLAAILVLRDAQAAPVARRFAGRAAMALAAAATLATLALGLWSLRTVALPAAVPDPAAIDATDSLQEPLRLLLWTVERSHGGPAHVAVGEPGDAETAEAATLLRAGEFGGAAAVMSRAGDSGLIQLLLGVARVHAGDGAAARAPLERALASLEGGGDAMPLAQAARLYLGEALLQSGDVQAARARLETLAGAEGERDAFADAAARRLEAIDRAAPAR